MARKIPMRKCVVTGEMHPKKDLLRVVVTPENTIEIDETGRKNGRGAYLFNDEEVIKKAIKTGALDSALRTKIPQEIYEQLSDYAKR